MRRIRTTSWLWVLLLMLLTTSTASASTLAVTSNGGVGTGTTAVANCATSGFAVYDYTVGYDEANSRYAVTKIIFSGLPGACIGGTLSATAIDSGSTALGAGSTTIAGSTATVNFSPYPPTSTFNGVKFAVTGP